VSAVQHPTVIGAFTPTEILTAWEAGATFVKVSRPVRWAPAISRMFVALSRRYV
jgi:2-keto-3-deoxy-6-phosphogluconate aldolase